MGGSFSHGAAHSPQIPPDSIEFVGRNGVLYANNIPFSIKGCNWFGSEAYNGPPNGLDVHSIGWYLDFLKRHNFNAIRLLFNHEHVLKDDIVETPQRERLLFQVRYVQMFKVIAREAAKRGLLILLACHRITHSAWPGSGLWYDPALGFSEARVLQSWDSLASQLCEQWNIFGVDLVNEPHASSWGKGLSTDWNKAAERIGNHVHSRCGRWLIFVEGVGYTPGAAGADDPGMGIWWGSNLVGARSRPVTLAKQEKLVYAPHVYGPSVYMQSYFRSPVFPNNMPGIWERDFAFAPKQTGRPLVLGEIGGSYVGADRIWQDWAIPYMVSSGFSCFYFALNPASDTGGFMTQDWGEPLSGSPEEAKLIALQQLPSSDVFDVCPACGAAKPISAPSSPPVVVAETPASKPLVSHESSPPPPGQHASVPSPSVPAVPESADGERPLPPLPQKQPPSALLSSNQPPGAAPQGASHPAAPPFPSALSLSAPPPPAAEMPQQFSHGASSLAQVLLLGLAAWLVLRVLLRTMHRLQGAASERVNTSLDQLMQQKKKAALQGSLPANKSITPGASKDSKKRPHRKKAAPDDPIAVSSVAEAHDEKGDEVEDSFFLLMHPASEVSETPCPDKTDPPEPGLARLPSTGQRVMISGLVKAAQHNGSEGVVTGHVPMQGGILRCNVSCDSGEKLCVQPENLMLVNQGAAVFSI